MDNFLILLQNKLWKRMHEEMKFEEELKEKRRKKADNDDDDDNDDDLLMVTGAAVTSLNSRNGGTKKVADK